MVTRIDGPAIPLCTRCGEALSRKTQAEHDADFAGAEHILELVANAQPDDWLMGIENFDYGGYRSESIEFLPVSGFARKNGKNACGHQLHYMRGGFWPRNDVLKVMSPDDALHAGLLPWSSFFSRAEDSTKRWPSVADAIMRLSTAEKRDLLMGRPLPKHLAPQPDTGSVAIKEMHPTQFWLRNGSMPVKGWTETSGGYLHMRAYDALNNLSQDNQLENCLPDKTDIFRAFDLVHPGDVRVVILGQDPYPAPGDAMGLSFSSNATKLPASLRNIYIEMAVDLGVDAPTTGDLTHLAYQGVLLANTALTLSRDGQSHFDYWLAFTEGWISALASTRPVVWILWGNHAKKWRALIERKSAEKHLAPIIIESAHPSPLSARRGFFGSKPFSTANAGLKQLGMPPVCWLPSKGQRSIESLF